MALALSFFVQEIGLCDPKPLDLNLSDTLRRAWAKNLIRSVPPSVATLEDAWRSPDPGAKTFLLIQDAHTNDSAQSNIAKILEALPLSKYVFLEAGDGDASLSFLRELASLPKRKRLAVSFLKKGELRGSEYLDIVSDKKFTLWGVEDRELYQKAIRSYHAVAKDREKFENYLKRISQTIDCLKPRLFNPSLLAFDEQVERFLRNETSLTEYFDALSAEAQKQGIALGYYPHLAILRSLRDKERVIDFKKASEEQARAVLSLSKEDLEGPHGLSKIGNRDQKEEKAFYVLLEEKLTTHPSRLTTIYPELFKYFDYLKLAQKLETRKFLEEQKLLEDRLYKALALERDEQELHKAAKALRTLKDLFTLTLTPDQYELYKKDPESYDITRLTGFLNKKIMDLETQYERALFLEPGYDDFVNHARDFYEVTYERDKAFIRNSLAKMADEKEAVLITGGYHSLNLKSLLKERGISYVCLTPQVLHETNRTRYEKILFERASFAHKSPQASELRTSLASTNSVDTWVTRQTPAEMSKLRHELGLPIPMARGARLANSQPIAYELRKTAQKLLGDKGLPLSGATLIEKSAGVLVLADPYAYFQAPESSGDPVELISNLLANIPVSMKEHRTLILFASYTGYPSMAAMTAYTRIQRKYETVGDAPSLALGTIDEEGRLRIFEPTPDTAKTLGDGAGDTELFNKIRSEEGHSFTGEILERLLPYGLDTTLLSHSFVTKGKPKYPWSKQQTYYWTRMIRDVFSERYGPNKADWIRSYLERKFASDIQKFEQLEFDDPGTKGLAGALALGGSQGMQHNYQKTFNAKVARFNKDLDVMDRGFYLTLLRGIHFASEMASIELIDRLFQPVNVEGLSVSWPLFPEQVQTENAEISVSAITDADVVRTADERLAQALNHQVISQTDKDAFREFLLQFIREFSQRENKLPNYPQTRNAWQAKQIRIKEEAAAAELARSKKTFTDEKARLERLLPDVTPDSVELVRQALVDSQNIKTLLLDRGEAVHAAELDKMQKEVADQFAIKIAATLESATEGEGPILVRLSTARSLLREINTLLFSGSVSLLDEAERNAQSRMTERALTAKKLLEQQTKKTAETTRAEQEALLKRWIETPAPAEEAAHFFIREPQFEKFLQDKNNRVLREFLKDVIDRKASTRFDRIERYLATQGPKAIGTNQQLIKAVGAMVRGLHTSSSGARLASVLPESLAQLASHDTAVRQETAETLAADAVRAASGGIFTDFLDAILANLYAPVGVEEAERIFRRDDSRKPFSKMVARRNARFASFALIAKVTDLLSRTDLDLRPIPAKDRPLNYFKVGDLIAVSAGVPLTEDLAVLRSKNVTFDAARSVLMARVVSVDYRSNGSLSFQYVSKEGETVKSMGIGGKKGVHNTLIELWNVKIPAAARLATNKVDETSALEFLRGVTRVVVVGYPEDAATDRLGDRYEDAHNLQDGILAASKGGALKEESFIYRPTVKTFIPLIAKLVQKESPEKILVVYTLGPQTTALWRIEGMAGVVAIAMPVVRPAVSAVKADVVDKLRAALSSKKKAASKPGEVHAYLRNLALAVMLPYYKSKQFLSAEQIGSLIEEQFPQASPVKMNSLRAILDQWTKKGLFLDDKKSSSRTFLLSLKGKQEAEKLDPDELRRVLGARLAFFSWFSREAPVVGDKVWVPAGLSPRQAEYSTASLQQLKALEKIRPLEPGRQPQPYILSNEAGTQELLQGLLSEPARDEPRVHVGFSGFINLDIMAARRSDYGILLDINPRQMELWEMTEQSLRSASTPRAFMAQFRIRLRDKELGDPGHFIQKLEGHSKATIKAAIAKWAGNEVYYSGGWLEDQKRYDHIRRMFLENRVVYLSADILDTSVFESIGEWLRQNAKAADTVYATNIREWVTGSSFKGILSDLPVPVVRANNGSMDRSLGHLSDKDTILIESKRTPSSPNQAVVSYRQGNSAARLAGKAGEREEVSKKRKSAPEINEKRELRGYAYIFEDDSFERLLVFKALNGVQDLYAGQLAFFVIVGRYALGQMLGRDRGFFEAYVKGVYFGVVSDSHILEIVHVNRDNYNLALLLGKNGTDLLGLVMLAIPLTVIREVLLTIEAAKLGGTPGGIQNGVFDLFFGSSAMSQLHQTVIAQSNGLGKILHAFKLSNRVGQVNRDGKKLAAARLSEKTGEQGNLAGLLDDRQPLRQVFDFGDHFFFENHFNDGHVGLYAVELFLDALQAIRHRVDFFLNPGLPFAELLQLALDLFEKDVKAVFWRVLGASGRLGGWHGQKLSQLSADVNDPAIRSDGNAARLALSPSTPLGINPSKGLAGILSQANSEIDNELDRAIIEKLGLSAHGSSVERQDSRKANIGDRAFPVEIRRDYDSHSTQYVRIGNLFFIDYYLWTYLAPALRSGTWPVANGGFGQRALLIPVENLSRSELGNVLYSFTIATLISLGSLPLSGKRVIEAGSGGGIPALGALSMGADSVVLIEKDPKLVDESRSRMQAAGYVEGTHFTILSKKIEEITPDEFDIAFPRDGKETVVVSDLGYWPGSYGTTSNLTVVDLVSKARARDGVNVTHFISSGHKNFDIYGQAQFITEKEILAGLGFTRQESLNAQFGGAQSEIFVLNPSAARLADQQLSADEFEEQIIGLFELNNGKEVAERRAGDKRQLNVQKKEVVVNGKTYKYTMTRRDFYERREIIYFRAGEYFVINIDAFFEARFHKKDGSFQNLLARYPNTILMAEDDTREGWHAYTYASTDQTPEEADREEFFDDAPASSPYMVLPFAISAMIAMQEIKDQISGKTFVDIGSRNGLLGNLALKLGAKKAVLIENNIPQVVKNGEFAGVFFIPDETADRLGLPTHRGEGAIKEMNLIDLNMRINGAEGRFETFPGNFSDYKTQTPNEPVVVAYNLPNFGIPYSNDTINREKLEADARRVGTTPERLLSKSRFHSVSLFRLASEDYLQKNESSTILADILKALPGTEHIIATGGQEDYSTFFKRDGEHQHGIAREFLTDQASGLGLEDIGRVRIPLGRTYSSSSSSGPAGLIQSTWGIHYEAALAYIFQNSSAARLASTDNIDELRNRGPETAQPVFAQGARIAAISVLSNPLKNFLISTAQAQEIRLREPSSGRISVFLGEGEGDPAVFSLKLEGDILRVVQKGRRPLRISVKEVLRDSKGQAVAAVVSKSDGHEIEALRSQAINRTLEPLQAEFAQPKALLANLELLNDEFFDAYVAQVYLAKRHGSNTYFGLTGTRAQLSRAQARLLELEKKFKLEGGTLTGLFEERLDANLPKLELVADNKPIDRVPGRRYLSVRTPVRGDKISFKDLITLGSYGSVADLSNPFDGLRARRAVEARFREAVEIALGHKIGSRTLRSLLLGRVSVSTLRKHSYKALARVNLQEFYQWARNGLFVFRSA